MSAGCLATLEQAECAWDDGAASVFAGLDLEVRAGEIVGVAGVSGNGQRDLAELVAGLQAPTGGVISVGGVEMNGAGTRRMRASGLAYVPEDRLGTGLSPSLSIIDNMVLTRPRGWFVDRKAAGAEATRYIAELEIKTPGPHTATRKLSGGNSQKVLLAREIFAQSDSTKVLVVCSPTRGLDVGAVETVHKVLDEARAKGKAVLLISEDLDEVLTLADKVLVLYRGAVVHSADSNSLDIEKVGMAMAGIS